MKMKLTLRTLLIVTIALGRVFGEEDCKMTERGLEYNGTMNVTVVGLPCLYWDSEYLERFSFNIAENFPDHTKADASNYCRNPDKAGARPWCFVNATMTSNIWKHCPIPSCPQPCLLTTVGVEYTGNISTTGVGDTCVPWTGPFADEFMHSINLFPEYQFSDVENFCRNPTKDPGGPWCYTTTNKNNPKKDFCEIPTCVTVPGSCESISFCNSHGSCTEYVDGSHSCQCYDGFSGENCEIGLAITEPSITSTAAAVDETTSTTTISQSSTTSSTYMDLTKSSSLSTLLSTKQTTTATVTQTTTDTVTQMSTDTLAQTTTDTETQTSTDTFTPTSTDTVTQTTTYKITQTTTSADTDASSSDTLVQLNSTVTSENDEYSTTIASSSRDPVTLDLASNESLACYRTCPCSLTVVAAETLQEMNAEIQSSILKFKESQRLTRNTDDRPTSKGMAAVSVLFITVVFAAIVLSDVSVLLKHFLLHRREWYT